MKLQCPDYSILQKSVAKSWLLENAIDFPKRIKSITYSDMGLLRITVGVFHYLF